MDVVSAYERTNEHMGMTYIPNQTKLNEQKIANKNMAIATTTIFAIVSTIKN